MRQKLLILLAALLSVTSAYAYDFSYEYKGYTLYFNKTSDTTCEVTYSENRYYGDIIIPQEVTHEGFHYNVTAIGSKAFECCSNLTSIEIPNSVTRIGNKSFWDCKSLSSIKLPNSLTEILSRAFQYCESLTSIELPNTVNIIGAYAFSGCDGLTSVDIPDSVIVIGENPFSGCINLATFYGKFASSDNRCLIEDGRLIAFAPYELASYIIPDTVTEIGSWAFCGNMTSIEMPNSVTAIGEYAFSNCDKLISVKLSNSLFRIYRYVFSGCISLNSIELPGSIQFIDSYAFDGCESLTSIEIPNSVKAIGASFQGCKNLASVKIYIEDPANINTDIWAFLGVPTSNCVLYVPQGSEALYAVVKPWMDFYNIIGFEYDSIHNIEKDAEDEAVFYDLNGRQVSKRSGGLYIRKGEKVFVK